MNTKRILNMSYKCIQLRGQDASSIKTEIMYEIATARVGGAELLRVNVCHDDDAYRAKLMSALHKILKAMKGDGKIQLFATEASFEQHSMEAEFLLNKYPDLQDEDEQMDGACDYVYVKI